MNTLLCQIQKPSLCIPLGIDRFESHIQQLIADLPSKKL